MHNRTLIALLTGTAALAVSSATWVQSTASTVGSTTTGSMTTADRAMGISTTNASTTSTGQSTSDTAATTAAAYSPRHRPGVPVSLPIRRDELGRDDIRAARFNLRNVSARLERAAQ